MELKHSTLEEYLKTYPHQIYAVLAGQHYWCWFCQKNSELKDMFFVIKNPGFRLFCNESCFNCWVLTKNKYE